MAATATRYTPLERKAALALYREHGACEAARRTGIKRVTLSSWAKREGIKSPNAGTTKAAVQAAQEWARRRVSLRDLSGQAAEEFLIEARRRMKENARAATDHMRSFSIAVGEHTRRASRLQREWRSPEPGAV